jgi:F-box/WD-40 domain protein 7
MNTGRCINSLYGHTDTIRCVQFDQDKIISGSDDSTVKVYDVIEGEHTIKAHPDAKITCLQFDNNKMVTGASDGLMNVWSALTGEKLFSLRSKAPPDTWVRCLQFAQELLISGHGDNNIRVWNFWNTEQVEDD